MQTSDGSLFPLNTDFRVGILVEMCMSDPQLTDEQRAQGMLRLYYGDLPVETLITHFEELAQYAMFFYGGGRERRKQATEKKTDKMIYSFAYDDHLIWAAFWDHARGVNLREIPYMHWWDFQAALWSLPEDCAFMRTVGIRSVNLDELKGKEREHYAKLQRDHAIPEARSVKQKVSRLEEILMNGGDLEGVL